MNVLMQKLCMLWFEWDDGNISKKQLNCSTFLNGKIKHLLLRWFSWNAYRTKGLKDKVEPHEQQDTFPAKVKRKKKKRRKKKNQELPEVSYIALTYSFGIGIAV